MQSEYEQRGYLREDFKLFHLTDTAMAPVDWHYHNFHKLMFFLSGHVQYTIEGKTYPLQPGDVVLVGSGCIHRPEMLDEMCYERIIVYAAPSFLRSLPECSLDTCFLDAQQQYSFVLRQRNDDAQMQQLALALEQALQTQAFGQALLARSLFLQLMVAVNRAVLDGQLAYVTNAVCDGKIVSVLQYINLHLTQPITVDLLARQCYISKYHLMRKFKEETGYTIHSYLTEKRLLLAREQIAHGAAVTDACYGCGFQDYSAFSRAYKKRFGTCARSDAPPDLSATLPRE